MRQYESTIRLEVSKVEMIENKDNKMNENHVTYI